MDAIAIEYFRLRREWKWFPPAIAWRLAMLAVNDVQPASSER